MASRIYEWLDNRLNLKAVERTLLDEPIPGGASWIYVFGSATLFLFVLQAVTGMFLAVYYAPTPDHAYDSVQFIMTRVPFGWLVRSIHAWSANLMVGAAFAHMFSVLFLKAYRRPREVTWVSGVLLLFLALGFGFTGYLLPWNELSYFATRVGTDIVGVLPGVGEFMLTFLRGGKDISGATLTRFYGFHVAVLPAIATALIGLHLLLVQYHGMSVPPSVEEKSQREGRPVPAMRLLDAAV